MQEKQETTLPEAVKEKTEQEIYLQAKEENKHVQSREDMKNKLNAFYSPLFKACRKLKKSVYHLFVNKFYLEKYKERHLQHHDVVSRSWEAYYKGLHLGRKHDLTKFAKLVKYYGFPDVPNRYAQNDNKHFDFHKDYLFLSDVENLFSIFNLLDKYSEKSIKQKFEQRVRDRALLAVEKNIPDESLYLDKLGFDLNKTKQAAQRISENTKEQFLSENEQLLRLTEDENSAILLEQLGKLFGNAEVKEQGIETKPLNLFDVAEIQSQRKKELDKLVSTVFAIKENQKLLPLIEFERRHQQELDLIASDNRETLLKEADFVAKEIKQKDSSLSDEELDSKVHQQMQESKTLYEKTFYDIAAEKTNSQTFVEKIESFEKDVFNSEDVVDDLETFDEILSSANAGLLMLLSDSIVIPSVLKVIDTTNLNFYFGLSIVLSTPSLWEELGGFKNVRARVFELHKLRKEKMQSLFKLNDIVKETMLEHFFGVRKELFESISPEDRSGVVIEYEKYLPEEVGVFLKEKKKTRDLVSKSFAKVLGEEHLKNCDVSTDNNLLLVESIQSNAQTADSKSQSKVASNASDITVNNAESHAAGGEQSETNDQTVNGEDKPLTLCGRKNCTCNAPIAKSSFLKGLKNCLSRYYDWLERDEFDKIQEDKKQYLLSIDECFDEKFAMNVAYTQKAIKKVDEIKLFTF